MKLSVVLLRGRDQKVRAFYNVFRYRCAKLLAANARGCNKSFTCEFHGWAYGLDGKLLAIPDADGFLQKDELGLVEVPLGIWNGFIFINPEKNPLEPVLRSHRPCPHILSAVADVRRNDPCPGFGCGPCWCQRAGQALVRSSG